MNHQHIIDMSQLATCNWSLSGPVVLIFYALYAAPLLISFVGYLVFRKRSPEMTFLLGLGTSGIGLLLVVILVRGFMVGGLRLGYSTGGMFFLLYCIFSLGLGTTELRAAVRGWRDPNIDGPESQDSSS